MRRIAVGIVVILGVLGTSGSALAGEHVDVPHAVDPGDKLKIMVRDCQSGDSWSAVILVRIEDPRDGELMDSALVDADDSGTTILKFKITSREYQGDRYKVYVKCLHEFDDGTQGTFWSDSARFRVRD
ncbi:MAG TPA: hypothetical protein VFK59_05070 [Actinomycetota bacterium]|jgi:hypothetical protein|nr:hypothetical protein [Actinomycetota bacterium]